MRVLIILASCLWAALAAAEQAGPNRLTVTGEGVVDSAPDMATLTLGVTTEGKTAATALREMSQASAEVLRRLGEAGVAARDLQTSGLNLSPVWDHGSGNSQRTPRIVGYTASNAITARIRDLPALGAILDAAVQDGANTFQGLAFGLQVPGPAQDAARQAAVAEAMRKATLYAEAAGLSLGEVLEFHESDASPRPVMLERMAAMSEAVPVAAGEVSIRAQVTMVFEISGP